MPLAAIAGIGAIGSIAGGIIGSNAAGHAADTQAAAANNAAQLEHQSATDALNFNKLQYGNSLALESPFVNTAHSANSRLAYLMGLTPNQGLPPGVVNPNAPAPSRTLDASTFDPGSLADLRALRAGNGSGIRPFTAEGGTAPFNRLSAMVPQTGMPNATIPPQFGGNPAGNNSAFSMNPAITSSRTAGNPFAPTGINNGINGPNGLPMQTGSLAPGSAGTFLNPDAHNFGTGGNTVTADGSPGMVARTDGGGLPSAPGQDPNSFGSLAQGWNKTFQSPTDVTEQNDPGYQFRLQQGQNALQNSAAARGGLLSGGTAKALNDYAQGSASSEYGNVYNRALQNYNTNYNTFTNDQTNEFNRLMALQSGGQVSANNLSASGITAAGNAANIGLTSAAQIGQQYNNAGAANASGYINSANAINGAISGAGNSLSTLALLRQLQGQGAGAGGGGV